MKNEKVWVSVRDSFWFLPTIYGIASIVAVVLTSLLDMWLIPKVQGSLPKLLFMEKSVAQTLYGALITSILTMTTISFSTIMVVLTTYSTQFSPRTLQDFMRSRVTQHVLGVFSFGFVFALINLLLLGSKQSKGLVSPFLTVMISIVCLAFFIVFIHYSSRFVQVNNLIGKIHKQTSEVIERTFDTKDYGKHEHWPAENMEEWKKYDSGTIVAAHSGYLQALQVKELIEWAKQKELLLEADFFIGSYIQKGVPVFRYWKKNEDEIDAEECLDYLIIGEERTDLQDIEFSIQKLVEIAVKAISPAINDPHTAVNCINRIGSLLTELGMVYAPDRYYTDDDDQLRMIMEPIYFRDYLYKSFYQIRLYGKKDVSVMNGVLEALYKVSVVHKGDVIQEDIWTFGKYIIDSAETDKMKELDFERFYQFAEKLAESCEQPLSLSR